MEEEMIVEKKGNSLIVRDKDEKDKEVAKKWKGKIGKRVIDEDGISTNILNAHRIKVAYEVSVRVQGGGRRIIIVEQHIANRQSQVYWLKDGGEIAGKLREAILGWIEEQREADQLD